MQLLRPFQVDEFLANAGIQTPGELMTGIHRNDVLNVVVMEHHQQLCAQRTIVNVARAQEQRAQELQHHVVQPHVLADHFRQLLDDSFLSSVLWTAKEEDGRLRLKTEQSRLLQLNVPERNRRNDASQPQATDVPQRYDYQIESLNTIKHQLNAHQLKMRDIIC